MNPFKDKTQNHERKYSYILYDLFAGTGNLLDYADQENERGEQGNDRVATNPPDFEDD